MSKPTPVDQSAAPIELKRTLGLLPAVGSGVGLIVGAGVYVVIGEAAGSAGNLVWFSVLLAGLAAFFTALAYAELGAMHPRAAASYLYVF